MVTKITVGSRCYATRLLTVTVQLQSFHLSLVQVLICRIECASGINYTLGKSHNLRPGVRDLAWSASNILAPPTAGDQNITRPPLSEAKNLTHPPLSNVLAAHVLKHP